jgi:hypothetical protein
MKTGQASPFHRAAEGAAIVVHRLDDHALAARFGDHAHGPLAIAHQRADGRAGRGFPPFPLAAFALHPAYPRLRRTAVLLAVAGAARELPGVRDGRVADGRAGVVAFARTGRTSA